MNLVSMKLSCPPVRIGLIVGACVGGFFMTRIDSALNLSKFATGFPYPLFILRNLGGL